MIRDASTLREALERIAGGSVTVTSERPVGGGCIASGARIEISGDGVYFVKRSSRLPGKMFEAEAAGLRALGGGAGPRVPTVHACRPGPGEAFIVMEWIEPGPKTGGFDRAFGERLAAMHRRRDVEWFGFPEDNYIGSTLQPNGWMDSWHDFYRERRVGFQMRLARDKGLIGERTVADIESILGRLESLLPAPEYPSILHGDLWGGNYLADSCGEAVLIDPATYYGHREADLAMTELFGGFGRGFYAAYRDAWPLEPGYRERAPLYNLYHMLNHANIFGGSYVGSVQGIVRRYR
ncbi:MAG: fructosamine kinase family protein [Spirochaetota bacterium]